MPQEATSISRRKFLGIGALAAGAGLLGWRFLAPGRRKTDPLEAIYRTITEDDDDVSVQRALARMERFLATLPKRARFELRAALQLVEHSPLVFHGYLSRFSALGEAERVRCLEGWRNGAHWRHPVFAGLKEFVYLAYYADPAHWARLGYSGPMVTGEHAAQWDSRYAGLVAPR